MFSSRKCKLKLRGVQVLVLVFLMSRSIGYYDRTCMIDETNIAVALTVPYFLLFFHSIGKHGTNLIKTTYQNGY